MKEQDMSDQCKECGRVKGMGWANYCSACIDHVVDAMTGRIQVADKDAQQAAIDAAAIRSGTEKT